jgi:hypothetical protein
MITNAIYLFLTFTCLGFQPKAAEPIDRTASLLKQGNLTEFYKSLSANLELTVLGQENLYSKDQSEVILNNFFSKNQPTDVKIIHRVDSNPNMLFAVYILATKNGNYRTSISFRNNNGAYEISELRIEDEKSK